MKKTKLIVIGIVAVLLAVLLFPVTLRYKDGGSVCHKAILYEVTVLHQLDEDEPDGYKDGLKIKLLGITVCDRSYDEAADAPVEAPPETYDRSSVEQYRVTFSDTSGCVYDIPSEEFYAPGTVLTLHSGVICDADLGMYVNGEFLAIQNAVDTGSGYIWEYTYEVGEEDVQIEFRIQGS